MTEVSGRALYVNPQLDIVPCVLTPTGCGSVGGMACSCGLASRAFGQTLRSGRDWGSAPVCPLGGHVDRPHRACQQLDFRPLGELNADAPSVHTGRERTKPQRNVKPMCLESPSDASRWGAVQPRVSHHLDCTENRLRSLTLWGTLSSEHNSHHRLNSSSCDSP